MNFSRSLDVPPSGEKSGTRAVPPHLNPAAQPSSASVRPREIVPLIGLASRTPSGVMRA
jgi:hypothetical protein